ncbi:hypothetical protein NM680_19975 [Paracoccus sp. PS-1]|uniref:Uncharacterized protein n=1 Tax=Paracoccus pantotrophus TaxID=82367 RepID=A0A7H9BT93_PARPN|nr:MULTISPECIES: hypothetical protein [Paracoccus]MDF3856208.1 hypothetical protein [Paracoccus pantotrophus]MDQ7264073.1 hypothetical protein [Paracoccus sp. PS1]QLH14075.1 hypothetical protein HYQ43_07455 [Paracoccus pantotrophus]SFP01768.1 hypothetical protein SAMN04244567_03626 [Paracoccus pantotrophus]
MSALIKYIAKQQDEAAALQRVVDALIYMMDRSDDDSRALAQSLAEAARKLATGLNEGLDYINLPKEDAA